MTYKLFFDDEALKEWKKLQPQIKEQFKTKLRERMQNPRVPKDKLRDMKDVYKIKLRSAGYRLAYRVNDKKIEIVVIAVGKRENNSIYETLGKRV
ncbi:MAG TPA: type II toxin-antitoxin system RelE/ParE family toxin [Cellvibrio sp.]|nr:type II toxin-antitoxin system RelE/ParE family toxin [Cellvibrio sp.]